MAAALPVIAFGRREIASGGMTQVHVAAALGNHESRCVSKCDLGERRIDPIDLADFARLYKRSLSYFVPNRS